MVGHGGSSAGSYLADPTSPIPSHCAVIILFKKCPSVSIVVTSTLRVNTQAVSAETTYGPLLKGLWSLRLFTSMLEFQPNHPDSWVTRMKASKLKTELAVDWILYL